MSSYVCLSIYLTVCLPVYLSARSELHQYFTPERSAAIVLGALGPGCSHLDIDIRSVRPWTMNALVADSYFSQASAIGRERVDKEGDTGDEGGVILVGDAAHQFPPAGGFGLNTGVQVRCAASALGRSSLPHCLDLLRRL